MLFKNTCRVQLLGTVFLGLYYVCVALLPKPSSSDHDYPLWDILYPGLKNCIKKRICQMNSV